MPPVAVTFTVAVPPLHNIVPAVELSTIAVGSDTVTLVLALEGEHPFASVTV